MTNDALLSLLGLCRKARTASFGHDAAKAALRAGRAKLCLICADASPRLRSEFETLAADRRVPCLQLELTMADVQRATQWIAAVITIDEPGFARKILL
ncbi:MAG: ribosomal L7Ae/L30e/S12e/Gadd45 family protein [Oscillospiraceae bacterium]|jgi:ribosomal protein L7Ae-like RNA K-turn-binding protein|nr:ribosomal L7Ae/L30e/S12e/Gadd45 family protein [Oscillospiraceae bacterium]